MLRLYLYQANCGILEYEVLVIEHRVKHREVLIAIGIKELLGKVEHRPKYRPFILCLEACRHDSIGGHCA
jgi:hypothetical protein